MEYNDFLHQTVQVFGTPFNLSIKKYREDITNTEVYRIRVIELDLSLMFKIDLSFTLELKNIIEDVCNHVILKIEEKIMGCFSSDYCTKELIVEKYFESFLYCHEGNLKTLDKTSLINNPNIILGRRRGHTQALVDFLSDPLYEDLIKETALVFPSRDLLRDFTARLPRDIFIKNIHRCYTNVDHLRGKKYSFFIFNNFSSIINEIPFYLRENPINKTHFTILGV